MLAPPMRCRISDPLRIGSAVRLCGAVVALLLGGCQSTPSVRVDWQGGPYFTPTNFNGVLEMPPEIRRVAVLPPAGLEGLPAESVATVTAALQSALLANGRVEVVTVDPELVRNAAGKPALASTELLPPALLGLIAKEHGADAVLFVDITLYRPYQPLALGVRAKLARCDESRAVFWAFDTVFDARDLAVANSARRHAAAGFGGIGDNGAAALQSPSRFAGYVFHETFATLPKRPPPAPRVPPAKVSGRQAD